LCRRQVIAALEQLEFSMSTRVRNEHLVPTRAHRSHILDLLGAVILSAVSAYSS
jgi:hypothetical protein